MVFRKFQKKGFFSVKSAFLHFFFCRIGLSRGLGRRGLVSPPPLARCFSHKTAPQGSSLSPYLWRYFDAIFTKMYKDGLENLRTKSECIESFFHIAYADDHVTVITLKIKRDSSMELIARLIKLISSEARNMLDLATKAAGCGINPDKSELVVPTKYAECCELAKDEFVWLGYSLKITNECKLVFTDSKMIARFKKSLHMVRSAFQYIRSIYVRWRIFKVYICPVIEWYLP